MLQWLMNSKKTIIYIVPLFLLSAPLPITAMLSKEQSTQEERNYTQAALDNEKKQTALLFNECKKNNPNLNNVRSCIEKGADVNAFNDLKATPLHYACIKNNVPLAQTLIDHGAQINLPGDENNTPLHLACEEGHIKITELLVTHGANIDSLNDSNDTPLHRACEFGHLPIVMLLIKNNAPVNAKNNKSVTSLHLACEGGFLEVAKLLINNKAYVDAINNKGVTPLHLACNSGYLNIVKLLIENGANKEARTMHGYTPLHVAVMSDKIKICVFLLQLKADPHAETNDSVTALDIACENNNKDIINLFKQYGISTISEQEAEKNMYAFFAELNEEEQQKKQTLEQRTKKRLAKKTEPNENTLLPQKEIEKRKPLPQTSLQSSPETTISDDTKEPMSNEPQQIIVTSPVITSSPIISSPTVQESVTTSSSIKSSSVIKEEKSSPIFTKTESSINQNNAYEVLQDAKLKWPRSLNPKQLESIKEHLKQLKNWPNLGGLDVKKLKDGAGMFRLRVGGHRITFSVNEAHRTIKIYSIGLRKNVYKKIKI